ncbi:MAG TPA: 50S ribosomal protein L31e [Methanomicrobiales archaeon]|nr:50S ribosomal protein L31e [Methanomicrobiales archaeon]
MVEKLKEQIYVIPMVQTKNVPRWQRSKRAVLEIREYLSHHMKSDDIKLDASINEKVWARGTNNPPSKIRVRAMKFEDGQVQAELAEE